jgi:glycosyltransferase involved in cell wall biosynthesis
MANIINNIYENPKNFETLKKNAREFIMNNFTWTSYEKKLLNVIENVFSYKG